MGASAGMTCDGYDPARGGIGRGLVGLLHRSLRRLETKLGMRAVTEGHALSSKSENWLSTAVHAGESGFSDDEHLGPRERAFTKSGNSRIYLPLVR